LGGRLGLLACVFVVFVLFYGFLMLVFAFSLAGSGWAATPWGFGGFCFGGRLLALSVQRNFLTLMVSSG
jgi:hypothetical protein